MRVFLIKICGGYLMLKKIIALLMSLVLIFAVTSFAFASSTITLHPSDGQSTGPVVGTATKVGGITPQIASNGTFTFSVSSVLDSDTFTINGNSITITAKATKTGTTNDYYITLYGLGCGLFGTKVKYIADGTNYSYTFSGLTGGIATYHFRIEPGTSTGTVTGDGSISGFKEVV